MDIVTAEEAISCIKQNTRVLLLIQTEDMPACTRAQQIVKNYEIRFEQLGFKLVTIFADEESSQVPELACVKVPQIRVFRSAQMITKQAGIPTEDFLIDTLNEVF